MQMFNIINSVQGKEVEQSPEPLINLPSASFNGSLYARAAGEDLAPGESIYDRVPKGSIAIIPLRGGMTKYSQFCGPVGTTVIADRILEADRHKNIAGTVVLDESGGGQLDAIFPMVQAHQRSTKVINHLCDSLSASANLIAASYGDKIYASNPDCRIGSLGVMAMFEDREQFYKDKGIVFRSYYSDYSFNKNKNEMEAIGGDGTLLVNNVLNNYARRYIREVSKNRSGQLRDNAETFLSMVDAGKTDKISSDSIFTGQMFMAEQCLPTDQGGNGLIDGIASLDEVIDITAHMAKNTVTIKL
jgi:ClpP class serine protease